MKKNNLLILTICSLITISACNNNSSNSSKSSTSSSINEVISGVTIAGPTSVYVGKTIRLIADVLGSENDDVTWSSSDTNIATINENGVLTGISEGSVEITATSKKDTSKSNTYTINVTLPKATGLSLFIEDNENVSYDNASDVYTVYLGQTFYIDTTFLPTDSKKPDISYSITLPSGSEDTSSVSLEIIPDTSKAKVISFASMDSLIITATGKYNDWTGQDLKASIEIDVVDKNLDKFNNVNEIVKSFKNDEISSLVSSSLTRTKEVTNDDTTIKKVNTITHNSFNNATYVDNNIKTYTNNELSNEKTHHYYQGFNTIDSKDYFYTFEYDDNEQIVELYESTNNKETTGLIMDINNSITYGYSNILRNILSSSTNLYEGDIASFGNTYIYAYANYEINSNSFKITSECFDEDYDINYKVSLEVNFTQNKLNGYNFVEEIDNGTSKIKFKEEGKDFVYSTKQTDSVANNDNYLDLNQYYITNFNIDLFNEKDPNGAYDYTNLNKYGANVSSENGLVKYTTTYDKTIVLKVNPSDPTTANVNFDIISATSSDTNQIPNVTSFKDGIFTINAKKDPVTAEHFAGKAIFTFTTSKGVQKQVVIEFVEAMLNSVTVNFGYEEPLYNQENNTYVFNSVFKGENSSYFYINTNPDESKYKFNINVISGDKDGISLYQYEDNNELGYPGFSYAIQGLKVGTYKFKIHVQGYGDISDQRTFEITVEEPYSKEYIAEKIIDNSYSFTPYGSLTTYTFKFTNETTLTYTESYTYQDSVLTSTFKYHIEDGAIIVDNVQAFTNGCYFGNIAKGKILFTRDFKTLSFRLQRPGELTYVYYNEFYKSYPNLTNADIPNFINGKTFISNEKTAELSFNNNKGTLIIKNYGGDELTTITFDYTYDLNSGYFTLTNVSSTTNGYTITSADFSFYSQEITIKVSFNNGYAEPYYFKNINSY